MPVLAGDPRIRRSGIGGSDIAKLAGVSRFGGAMEVWLEKTGQSAPLIETERMRWGTLLEDAVAREYAHKKGRKVRNAPTTLDPVTNLRARVVRYAADRPWRMGNVDRLTSDPKDAEAGLRRGLECKTADRFAAADFGEEGTDEVPPDYLLQCMWYLGVTGYDMWDLAVLIGGNTHRIYTIPRDDELIEKLWLIGDEFWGTNVLRRVPPDVDDTEATRRYLESRHTDPAVEVPMTDSMLELAYEYAALTGTIRDSEKRKDLVGNQLRDAMGAAGLAARDNAKVRWSVVTTHRLDTKALTEAQPGIAAQFTKESTEHRLTVTVKEDR